MKQINKFIYEKLRLSKTEYTESDFGIHKTTWRIFQNVLVMFGIRDKTFHKDFKDSTNNAGDIYWIAVQNPAQTTDSKMGRTFFIKTRDNTDTLWVDRPKYLKCEKNLKNHFANYKKHTCLWNDAFTTIQFIIHITTTDNYPIMYIVSGTRNDIEDVYEMFMDDGWNDVDINIYDLCKK